MEVLTKSTESAYLSAGAPAPERMNSSRLPAIVAFTSVLVATLLIFWCYRDLSTTWDEPAHLGPGMQLLSKGVYDLDAIDPPLPRVSTAIGPYLLGIRSFGRTDPYDEGNQILAAHGNAHLHTVLTAARLGILPYFLIASFLPGASPGAGSDPGQRQWLSSSSPHALRFLRTLL
jgi:hypothetical protein